MGTNDPPTRRRAGAPPRLSTLGAMDTPDHADAFTLTGHPRAGHSAEE
ncbi:hypothetical protein [Streptomyces rubiginosohelvolus]